MELAGLAGILASLLGLALTVYGVFFNGRATRALITQTQAAVEAGHRDTHAMIEHTHHDTVTLLQAIQTDIKSVAQNGQHRHDDLVAYMKDMDRRHTELLAEIAKKP